MPKNIPISALKKIAIDHDLRQVIVLAWDGIMTYVATYGVSVEDCAQAAEGGNRIKKSFGWPEEMCNEQPSQIKKLNAKIKMLEEALALIQEHKEK